MPALIEVRSSVAPQTTWRAVSLSFASGLNEGELRDLPLALTESLSAGFDFTLLDSSTELTPQQAASRIEDEPHALGAKRLSWRSRLFVSRDPLHRLALTSSTSNAVAKPSVAPRGALRPCEPDRARSDRRTCRRASGVAVPPLSGR